MRNADFTVSFKMAMRLYDSARAVSLTLPFKVFLKCQEHQLQVLHLSADPGVHVCEGERGAAYFSLDISLPALQAMAC